MSDKIDTFEDDSIVIYSGNGIQNISLEQFPEVIGESLRQMEELDKKYRKAEVTARSAKAKVADAQKIAEDAKKVALSVVDESDEVKKMSAGLFQKKATIEGIRDNSVNLAKSQKGLAEAIVQVTDTQDSFAVAQADTMEALRVSFEFDKDMANVTKYLFLLGCSSLAASQTVSRTLEMKLRDASEEEISEFARAELQSVVDNLKAQEHMLQKQKQIEDDLDIYIDKVNSNRKAISEHEARLKDQAQEIQKRIDKEKELSDELGKHIDRLDAGDEKDAEQDDRLDAGDERDAEQDDRLDAGDEKDVEQDNRLDAGDKKDAEQDDRLDAGDEKDVEQDNRLDAGDKKDAEQDSRLDELRADIYKKEQTILELKELIEKIQSDSVDSREKINSKIEILATKKQVLLVGGIGIISLLVSLIQFFI